MGQFIGHNEIVKNFSKRVDENNLSHAHIIVGENGIGKSKLARKFSLEILSAKEDRNYIDIVSYKSKKASFGVDEVREIIEEVNKKPFEGDKKVIIIHDGNKITTQAQNALLKTLEEPPKGVYIIILCESLELILDTIKSRCQIYKLTPLSKTEIKQYLINLNRDFTENELRAAIAYSEGIPGKAEDFLNNVNLNNLRDLLISIMAQVSKNLYNKVIELEGELLKYRENKEDILNILSSLIRDIILYKEIDNSSIMVNVDKIEDIQKLAINMSYKKLNGMMEKVIEARRNILNNSNFSISIRVMLIGFMEV